jgi:hypothetical protein
MTQSTLRSGHTPTPYPHPCKLIPKKLPRNLLPILLTLASTRPVNSSILKILPRNLRAISQNYRASPQQTHHLPKLPRILRAIFPN